MTRTLLLIAAGAVSFGQNLPDVLQQGEKVFAETCATGYCHGLRGTAGGAPRLVGRGFDPAFINNIVTRGVPGTAMPGFGESLPRPDVIAVVSYVATLNGVANPNIGAAGSAPAAPEIALSPGAARGRDPREPRRLPGARTPGPAMGGCRTVRSRRAPHRDGGRALPRRGGDALAGGQILDCHSLMVTDQELMAFPDPLCITNDRQQAVVDGIPIIRARKTAGQDRANARAQNRRDRYFHGRATTKIRSRDQNIPWLHRCRELGINLFKKKLAQDLRIKAFTLAP